MSSRYSNSDTVLQQAMILEGDHGVIDAIKEKKRLMDAGEAHEHIRPMLVCGGGCMKAAYSWGALLAFADLGYERSFHTMAGISAGALAVAYLLSGNMRDVETLAYDETVGKNFFNLYKPFNILNTMYLREVLERTPGRSLNPQAIIDHQIRFIIGVSRFQTATPHLLEPKNSEELFQGLCATISMAGAVSNPVFIHNERYLDGATTYPYIRNDIYALDGITHILDLTNQDQDMETYNYIEALLLATIYRGVTNRLVRKAANGRRRERKAFLQQVLKEQRVPTCAVWGDHSIGSLEARKSKMKDVTERSRAFWVELLG